MKRHEYYTIFFILLVNALYFFIVFSIYLSVIKGQWDPILYFSIANNWKQFYWLAEWFDFILFLRFSDLDQFLFLSAYPILGASYLYWVGQAALITGSLMASYIPFLTPFHYFALYMGLFNILFEVIFVIFTMRLVGRYFGQVYASNVMFIFIISPIVWWVTICRWDMLLLALTASTLYFAVENRPWLAWLSLTIAILVKTYPVIFAIPLLLYYLKRDRLKKTLSYILSMIGLGVLIYVPFLLTSRYGTYLIFYGITVQSRRGFTRHSTWYWISLLFEENTRHILFAISSYIQLGIIFTYFLFDYFYEAKKENPLSIDKALIKRVTISSLLLLLTLKLGLGYQYAMYAVPFVLIFINCFKKFSYFISWLVVLHIANYLTIIIHALGLEFILITYLFFTWITLFILYTVTIGLIHSNKKLYENTIPILNERDFMLGLYNLVKKTLKM